MFFLFMTQMIAWGSPTFISEEFEESITLPECTIDGWDAVLDMLGCFFSNLYFFFQLMTVNSEFLVIGLVLITPLAIGIAYIILHLIATAIP